MPSCRCCHERGKIYAANNSDMSWMGNRVLAFGSGICHTEYIFVLPFQFSFPLFNYRLLEQYVQSLRADEIAHNSPLWTQWRQVWYGKLYSPTKKRQRHIKPSLYVHFVECIRQTFMHFQKEAHLLQFMTGKMLSDGSSVGDIQVYATNWSF